MGTSTPVASDGTVQKGHGLPRNRTVSCFIFSKTTVVDGLFFIRAFSRWLAEEDGPMELPQKKESDGKRDSNCDRKRQD